jgi:hypothetical protein
LALLQGFLERPWFGAPFSLHLARNLGKNNTQRPFLRLTATFGIAPAIGVLWRFVPFNLMGGFPMPYTTAISRSQPTAFLFVIDQSGSMEERMVSGKTKADFVADVLNKTIYQLVIRATRADGVRDYFDLGVIAYGGHGVGSGFGGALAGNVMHPLSAVEKSPLRIDTRNKKVDDGAGGLVEQSVKFPVWFDPRSSGGTPMCEALKQVASVLVGWCNSHERSYPPTVIHVTDGQSTDGDPESIAQQLQQISTNDGPLLLFNLHIDATGGAEVIFPSSDASLPNAESKLLFRCSSLFPSHLLKVASEKGHQVSPESRFFGYRVGIEGIVDFFDIGTRASEMR